MLSILRQKTTDGIHLLARRFAQIICPSPLISGNESDTRSPDERVEPPTQRINSGSMRLDGNEILFTAGDDGYYRLLLDFDRWDAHGFWIPGSRNTIHIRTPDGKAFQQIKCGVHTEWQQVNLPVHAGRDCPELRLALLRTCIESTKQSKHHPVSIFVFGAVLSALACCVTLRFGPEEERKELLRVLAGAANESKSVTVDVTPFETPALKRMPPYSHVGVKNGGEHE